VIAAAALNSGSPNGFAEVEQLRTELDKGNETECRYKPLNQTQIECTFEPKSSGSDYNSDNVRCTCQVRWSCNNGVEWNDRAMLRVFVPDGRLLLARGDAVSQDDLRIVGLSPDSLCYGGDASRLSSQCGLDSTCIEQEEEDGCCSLGFVEVPSTENDRERAEKCPDSTTLPITASADTAFACTIVKQDDNDNDNDDDDKYRKFAMSKTEALCLLSIREQELTVLANILLYVAIAFSTIFVTLLLAAIAIVFLQNDQRRYAVTHT
jgi:hypothetical protein